MMPENWTKYGFPEPTFRTPYLPYAGLCKALNERARAIGYEGGEEEASEDIITIPDKFTKRHGSPVDRFWGIDEAIRSIVAKFVRPEKYEDLGVNSSLSDMLWTWEDLLLAGADGVEADVIDSTANPRQRLVPNWSVKWAQQRYKMLNLLRYAVVTPEYTYWESVNGEWFDSKYEAYQSAIAAGSIQEPQDGGPSSEYTGSRSWDAYQLQIFKLVRFAPVFPAGISGLNSWAVAMITSLSGAPQSPFDPVGSGLTPGWHQWTAVNGYFINDPTLPPYPTAWDSYTGDAFYAGWEGKAFPGSTGDNSLCYADFNPIFNFKEEDA